MAIPIHTKDQKMHLLQGDSLELGIDLEGYSVPDGAAWTLKFWSAATGGVSRLDASAHIAWTEDTVTAGDGALEIDVPAADMATIAAATVHVEISFTSGTTKTTLVDDDDAYPQLVIKAR